jgi:ADP-heptose:LPS heptosyltransferase
VGGSTPYRRKNTVLGRLDRLRSGEQPRILITRTQGGIGDVLMTLPTVKAIYHKYGTKVDYGTDFGYLDGALPKVLRHNPYINQLISWRDKQAKVDKEVYDAILDLTCPCIAHEVPHAPPVNRIDLFARHLGVHLPDTSIDYTIEDGEHKWAQLYLEQNNLDRNKLVLVQPSASASPRSCPVSKMKDALIRLLTKIPNLQAIVITHSSDNHGQTDWNVHRVHRAHDLDIREIGALMHRCDLVICPDSSILHLAGALNKKTLSLFGPTDPRARVNYYPHAIALWPAQHYRNYPCWYDDPGDGYICWKLLEEEFIATIAAAMLNNRALPSSKDIVSFGQYKQGTRRYETI